jgi:hypothetical protein
MLSQQNCKSAGSLHDRRPFALNVPVERAQFVQEQTSITAVKGTGVLQSEDNKGNTFYRA